MKLRVIGTIAIVLVSVIVLGCIESQPNAPTSIVSTPNPTPVKTSILITASPSQMLPTINDMPDGTRKLDEMTNETYAERKFVLNKVFPQTLIYMVYKFSSINEAIDKYNSIKDEKSDYKLTDVNLGNEGYGLEEVPNSVARVVFRKANAVVKVIMIGPYVTTLSDTISYAKMVKTPTSTLKLVADTKTVTQGETWNIGDGYALKVIMIDQKANPKQVWLELDRNGNKLDDKVLLSGQTYNYNNILSTKIDSISDTEIVLRDTYIVS